MRTGKGAKDKSPEPTKAEEYTIHVEVDSQTGDVLAAEMKTGVTKTPEAPPVPSVVKGLAMLVTRKWGVPAWLIYHASYTGSRFGTRTKANNAHLGVVAKGTEPKGPEGYAWYGNAKIAYDKFGSICSGLNLDYSNPKVCIAALKERCPEIDTIPHTQFMEA